MNRFRKGGIWGFLDEMDRMSRLTSPKWLSDLEKTSKIMSGVSGIDRLWQQESALTKALGASALLQDYATISEKLLGKHKVGGMFDASLKASELLTGAATDNFKLLGLTDWHRRQASLGGIAAVNKLTEDALVVASKYSLLGTSHIGRNIFQAWDDRFDSLRAIAASAQVVTWMSPLVPAMLSLTELAEEDLPEEDRLAKLRSILASFVASAPRHLNFDRLFAIFAFIWALLPSGQMSEQMKEGFRQLREQIRENRVAAELEAEQLRELQIQVLLATEGIESGYVATIETTARIKTRRSGRSGVLGKLSPGEPVIVLLLRGRWAYVEAETGNRHVVGWIPKKSLSKPRRALLPDMAVPATGFEAVGGASATE